MSSGGSTHSHPVIPVSELETSNIFELLIWRFLVDSVNPVEASHVLTLADIFICSEKWNTEAPILFSNQ